MRATTGNNTEYSTKKVSEKLLENIQQALKSIDSYGSVELFVQDNMVTQITTRNIHKTSQKNGKI